MNHIKYQGIVARSEEAVQRLEKINLIVPENSNPSIFVFGEKDIHDSNEANLQKDIAHILQADYFLHERLRNYLFIPNSGNGELVENPKYSKKLSGDEALSIHWTHRGSKNMAFVNWAEANLRKKGCNINRYEQENFGFDFDSNLQIHLAGLRSIKSFVGCGFSHMQILDLSNKYGIDLNDFDSTKNKKIQVEKEARASMILKNYAKDSIGIVMVVNENYLEEESVLIETLASLKKKGIESVVIN